MFPTPYIAYWHAYSQGAEDGHGNVGEPTYTPPLDEEGTPTPVIFIAPGGSTEPNEVRVEHDLDIGVPPAVTATPNDVVDLPEGQFQVVGYLADYTKGPWGFNPGKVVKLKRVES